VHGDWLVIGTTPQSVETYLKRADGKLPKWEASPDLITAQKMLPEKFVSLTYSDPRTAIQTALGLAPTGITALDRNLTALRKRPTAAGAPATSSVKFPLTPEDVPLAEEVTAPLFASVAVCTVDAEGIHWKSRNAFPSLPVPSVPGGSGGVETVELATLLVAMLAPVVEVAREEIRVTESRNNLRRIALALYNYQSANNQLPPGTLENKDATTPEEHLSWLVEILPNLDQQDLYGLVRKDKSFADEANKKAFVTKLPVFVDSGHATADGLNDYGQTTYVGIAGVGKEAPFLKVGDPKAGMFGYDRKTTFSDVKDGLSNTVMVSNTYQDFGPWGQGGRATIRSLTAKPYVKGPDGLGSDESWSHTAMIALGDGSVRSISENIDPAVFEALATIAGGEKVGDY
jgi:hypothetical protein